MFDFENFPFDDRDFDTPRYQESFFRMSQEGRPHIFVKKLRERQQTRHVLGSRERPSRFIGVDDYASALAASQFAFHFGLTQDLHVTIDFGRMGRHEPAEVQGELSGWTKCLGEWCREHGIPCAWIYSIEMSSKLEYHAHVAVHVPGDSRCEGRHLRRKFRAWVKGYTGRRGKHVPRAIKVRGGREESELGHWIVFQYLVKGYDPNALVCSPRNSPDGLAVRLGDLIAKYHRDPGPVELTRRIGVSNSLGPARRAMGAPTGLDDRLPQEPDWSGFEIDRITPLTRAERVAPSPTKPVQTPFRSTFEDGIYDVRRLYSARFYEHVTRLSAESAPNVVSVEQEDDDAFDLTTHLLSLDI